jgi:putative membrane protein
MRLLLSLIINAIAVSIASYILPGVHVASLQTVLVVAVVLGVVNTFLRPVLMLLTLPITLITLGLFTLVINGLLVLLVTWIVPGFQVDNFFWAILFSLVVSLVSWFLAKLS